MPRILTPKRKHLTKAEKRYKLEKTFARIKARLDGVDLSTLQPRHAGKGGPEVVVR